MTNAFLHGYLAGYMHKQALMAAPAITPVKAPAVPASIPNLSTAKGSALKPMPKVQAPVK